MATFTIVAVRPGGTGTISIQNAGKAVEIWTVVGDSPNYTTEDLRSSGTFPEVYTTFHAQNPRLRLMPIEIDHDTENPAVFTCTVTWTSDKLDPQKEESEKDEHDDPLDRTAKIAVETQFAKETRHRDFYSKRKCNAVGDLFDPPIENNATMRVIRIRKNVTVFPDWAFDYADSVNSEAFVIKGRTFAKGCVYMAYVKLGEIQTDGPTPYSEANVEMWVKKRRQPRPSYVVPEVLVGDKMLPAGQASFTVEAEDPETIPGPWETEQLNEGLYCFKGGDKSKKQRCKVKDDAGELIDAVSPVPLAANGDQLYPVTVDNATYIVFRDHEEKDFNALSSLLWSDA